ncbi:GID complex subunit 4, VID24 [Podila horticola]|nr:GID complex subunit 4, VID24 [Podila horticola]
MPAFTQICSDPVVDTTVPCTCSWVVEELDMALDSDNGMFMHINGVQHWATCALSMSLAHCSTTLLKQQQQTRGKQRLHRLGQDDDGDEDMDDNGATLLRKPPPSRFRPNAFDPVRLLPTTTFHLFPGSKFKGKQKSGSSCYDVMVDIKDVNLNDSSLCGYLHINGLTEEYPELTTFFEAEIVGPDYSFVTRKWEADVKTDKEHWTLFKPFEHMADTFAQEKFKYDYRDPNNNVIFMRWKEHFLVPDHRVEGITGASFAGFYYICYNKLTGNIDGYYYHRTSEKFQKLTLTHAQERPSFGSYEFR